MTDWRTWKKGRKTTWHWNEFDGSGSREGIITEAEFMVGSISAEMQLPADAGGPPHGGNHPPMDPLTLRGGATMGESEKIPLDDFTIGEISTANEDVVER